jgi:hypothetical protein
VVASVLSNPYVPGPAIGCAVAHVSSPWENAGLESETSANRTVEREKTCMWNFLEGCERRVRANLTAQPSSCGPARFDAIVKRPRRSTPKG